MLDVAAVAGLCAFSFAVGVLVGIGSVVVSDERGQRKRDEATAKRLSMEAITEAQRNIAKHLRCPSCNEYRLWLVGYGPNKRAEHQCTRCDWSGVVDD